MVRTMLRLTGGSGTVALLLLCTGPIGPPLSATQRPSVDQDLTTIEQDQARRLAASAVEQRALVVRRPVVIGRVELLRAKGEDGEPSAERHALVTLYRYEGDLGILAAVNLAKQAVVSLDTVPGLPVPLAQEEFDRARTLALADPEVRRSLGGDADRVVIEPLVLRTSDTSDSLYSRRVVRLLFRIGQDYLSDPIVLVDLTAERVLLEHPRR